MRVLPTVDETGKFSCSLKSLSSKDSFMRISILHRQEEPGMIPVLSKRASTTLLESGLHWPRAYWRFLRRQALTSPPRLGTPPASWAFCKHGLGSAAGHN